MITSVGVFLLLVMTISLVLRYWKTLIHAFQFRKMMAKLPTISDVAYPLIGHSYLFPSNPSAFFRYISNVAADMCETATNDPVGVVWLGPVPLIIAVHPDAAEVLLRSSKHMEKAFVYRFLHPWLGTGLLTSMGAKWQTRRRLITPTFHFNILQDFLEIMNEQASTMMQNISIEVASSSNKMVNVEKAITLCALDIICETAMGKAVSAQTCQDSKYVKAIHRISEIIQLRQTKPQYWWDFAFHKLAVGREHDQVLNILHTFTRDVIKDRSNDADVKYNAASRRMAFLDVLLRCKTVDGVPLSLDDIQEEVDTFMFEGHDTTASGMTWALYLLGRHEDVQRRVHEELDAVFCGNQTCPIMMNDLRKLQYLEQVIKEALRVYPSVPLFARVTSEDAIIGDHTIPKGAEVVIFSYAIHHHPKFWANPEKFDPDRFTKKNCVNRHPYSYIPFSAGPRNCIGQKFALQEEKVILAHLLRQYKVVSHDCEDHVQMSGDLILRPTNGLNISLIDR